MSDTSETKPSEKKYNFGKYVKLQFEVVDSVYAMNAPMGPIVPVGPFGPVAPFSPMGPFGPVGPFGPFGPFPT